MRLALILLALLILPFVHASNDTNNTPAASEPAIAPSIPTPIIADNCPLISKFGWGQYLQNFLCGMTNMVFHTSPLIPYLIVLTVLGLIAWQIRETNPTFAYIIGIFILAVLFATFVK